MNVTRICALFLSGMAVAVTQAVRLPDWNGAYGTEGAVSHFFQPTEGLDLLDGDGALFILVEMPKGETKVQNGEYGFNRYLMGTDRRATSNNNFFLAFNPPKNWFVFQAKSAAGSIWLRSDTLSWDGGMIDETTVLVMVQRSGDTFSFKVVSGTDGRVYDDGTDTTLAGFSIAAKTGDDGFAVGGAATTPTDATFDRERGHNGNIEFVGYATTTISDADARAMALGGDPVTVIGEANLRWYRNFSGAEARTTLAPTVSGDATRSTTVRGAEYMVGGATIRRQAPDTYFMMDYIPDGRVWGLNAFEPTSRSVTLTGTHAGLVGGTTVQVRVLNAADMGVVTDWTDATTVMNDSTWNATFTMAKSHGWDYVEARPATDTNLVCRSRSRCGVGYKIGMMGQSETHYMLVGYGASMVYDGEAVSFVSHGSDNPVHNFSGSIATVRTPQIYVAEPWDKLSDGVLALARQLQRYTDAPVCVVNHSVSGTAAQALADDDDDDRRWVDLLETVKLAGNDYSLMHWMWWVTANWGLVYGAQIFDPIVLGIEDAVTPGVYEHYLYDGTFVSGMRFGVAGFWGLAFSRSAIAGTTAVYDLSNLNATIKGQYLWRDANADGRAGVAAFPGATAAEFPVGWDIECDKTHWGHSDKSSPMGPTRLGYRAGEFVARIFGFSTSENPKLLNAWFGTDHGEINVRFTLPNGGILHTAGAPSVAGLWTSMDGGASWIKDRHTAVVSDAEGGIVTMTKDSGTWPDSVQVAFGVHQVELDDSASCLYEGPADGGSGTGVLAMEDGLGIPVQPYVPVPHAAAKVTVQESDPGNTAVSTVPDCGAVSADPEILYDLRGSRISGKAGSGIYIRMSPEGVRKTVIVR